MRLTHLMIATLATASLVLGACGDDDATDGGADPTSTCEAGNPDCGNDTPLGDEDPAADPFATCEAGDPDCGSDTPEGDADPFATCEAGDPACGDDTSDANAPQSDLQPAD